MVEDSNFPGHEAPVEQLHLKDEIYQIKDFSRENVRVLLSLDSQQGRSQSSKGVHRNDDGFRRSSGPAITAKGRVLYNGLGHHKEVWDRPDIQKMWLEMVEWSMGMIPGDATPRPRPTIP